MVSGGIFSTMATVKLSPKPARYVASSLNSFLTVWKQLFRCFRTRRFLKFVADFLFLSLFIFSLLYLEQTNKQTAQY